MTTLLMLITAAIAYFLGNFNAASILSRILGRKGTDARDEAPSLAVYSRTFGPVGVGLIILGDVLKSLAAVWIGGLILRDTEAAVVGRLFAGFCLIMGHEFPVVYRYKGRSGLLCGFLTAVLADWRVGFGCLAIYLLVLIFFRYLSLAGIVAPLFSPILLWMFTHETIEGTLALLCALLIVLRFAENILNLITGTEPRLEFRQSGSRSRRRG